LAKFDSSGAGSRNDNFSATLTPCRAILALRARVARPRGPSVVAPPFTGTASISIARDGASVIITYTGVLQSSATLGLGTFTDVAGATSPYSLPMPTSGTLFFRARP